MGWRGPAVLALLVVLGAVGGFGMSRGLADASVGEGTAQPVGAEYPTAPGEKVFVPRKDPTDATLPPDIELTEARLGNGRSAITYPVPVGWKPNHMSADVVKWKKPKTSNNTYVMRVTDVRSRNQTGRGGDRRGDRRHGRDGRGPARSASTPSPAPRRRWSTPTSAPRDASGTAS